MSEPAEPKRVALSVTEAQALLDRHVQIQQIISSVLASRNAKGNYRLEFGRLENGSVDLNACCLVLVPEEKKAKDVPR